MQVAEKRAQRPWMVVGAVLLVTSGVSAAMDSWVSIGPDGKVALEEVARETAPLLTVNRSDDSRLDVSLALGGFALRTSRTKGGRFVEVHWPDAGMAGQIGQPALPVARTHRRALLRFDNDYAHDGIFLVESPHYCIAGGGGLC